MAIHAWICGIDDYGDWDASHACAPGSADLRLAVSDAMLVEQHLRDLGAEISIHVAPRRWKETRQTATRRRSLAGLTRLLARAAKDPEGIVLLGFFGHGAVDADGRAWLCPTDTGRDLRNAIPLDGLRKLLDRYLPDRPVGFLCDAAFGSDGKEGAGKRTLTPLAAELRPVLREFDLVSTVLGDSEPDPWWSHGRMPDEVLLAVRKAIRRLCDFMEVAATHDGFRICKIVGADGEPLGRFVVTGPGVQAAGWKPGKDYWLWDTERPWPEVFSVRDQRAMLFPYPPDPPDEPHVEVFHAGAFGTARTTQTPTGGQLYELFDKDGRPREAWVWRDPAPLGRQEWFAAQTVGGYLDLKAGDALVFRTASRGITNTAAIELTRYA